MLLLCFLIYVSTLELYIYLHPKTNVMKETHDTWNEIQCLINGPSYRSAISLEMMLKIVWIWCNMEPALEKAYNSTTKDTFNKGQTGCNFAFKVYSVHRKVKTPDRMQLRLARFLNPSRFKGTTIIWNVDPFLVYLMI